MGRRFWIKRFLVVAVLVFVILMAVELLKGHTADEALINSLVWGLISATIFTVARIYHSRRGRACALCGDTPDMTPDK
ncbi:MAG: hypothetical protein ABI624_13135 [Casimicrobiaceae bacterium]